MLLSIPVSPAASTRRAIFVLLNWAIGIRKRFRSFIWQFGSRLTKKILWIMADPRFLSPK